MMHELRSILNVYLNVRLQVLYPVQFPDIKVEHLLVLLRYLRPQFVHVVVAPLPGVGGEGLQGLGGLLQEGRDLDQEGSLANQPAEHINHLGRALVEQKL